MDKYTKLIDILRTDKRTNSIYEDIFFSGKNKIIKDYQVKILLDMMFDINDGKTYFNALSTKFRFDFANFIIGFPEEEKNPEVDVVLANGLYKSLGVIADNFGFENKYSYEICELPKSLSMHKQLNKFYRNKHDDFLLNTVGIVITEKPMTYGVKLLSPNERKHLMDERYKNATKTEKNLMYELVRYCKTYC